MCALAISALAGDHLGWFLGSSRAEACRAAENACATKHSTRSQQLDAARQTPTPKGAGVEPTRTCTRGLRPSSRARHPYSKPKSVHRGATADNVGAHVSFDRLDLGSARPCSAPTHPISFRPGPYFRNAPNLRFYRVERRSDAARRKRLRRRARGSQGRPKRRPAAAQAAARLAPSGALGWHRAAPVPRLKRERGPLKTTGLAAYNDGHHG